MENIIRNLVEVAEMLEKNKDVKNAQVIDKVAQGLINIKTAQYVGVQGYAIRNSRCFSNCYRQKRASKPTLTSHDVWKECHKEYVASINNDGSKWDKYADSNNLIKTASVNKDQVKVFNLRLAHAINEKVQGGMTHSFAINDTIENFNQILINDLANAAENLDKIANKYSYNVNITHKISEVKNSLAKEAQWFAGLRSALKTPMQQFKMDRNIGNLEAEMEKAHATLAAAAKKIIDLKEKYQNSLNSLQPANREQQLGKERALKALESLRTISDPNKIVSHWQRIKPLIRGLKPTAATPVAAAPVAAPAAGTTTPATPAETPTTPAETPTTPAETPTTPATPATSVGPVVGRADLPKPQMTMGRPLGGKYTVRRRARRADVDENETIVKQANVDKNEKIIKQDNVNFSPKLVTGSRIKIKI